MVRIAMRWVALRRWITRRVLDGRHMYGMEFIMYGSILGGLLVYFVSWAMERKSVSGFSIMVVSVSIDSCSP